eukprot:TRINITY_DN8065_c0_g1_i1.p1 TRINITY_DN8065_c0_g1~~TRINITY_DN8065_c0_g1_i1.p1  ORF type:complete len:130 (+),score=41.45 TRINITY_DN8065_c0_g1_i1:39-392(+)
MAEPPGQNRIPTQAPNDFKQPHNAGRQAPPCFQQVVSSAFIGFCVGGTFGLLTIGGPKISLVAQHNIVRKNISLFSREQRILSWFETFRLVREVVVQSIGSGIFFSGILGLSALLRC